LNGNFNIAGHVVNMAARVMGLADPSQIFLTKEAYRSAAEMIPGIEKKFRRYRQAQIKHELRIDVYQYTGSGHEGLDVSPKAGLGLTDDETDADDEVTPVSLSSSSKPSSDSQAPRSLLNDLQDRMVSVPGGEFLMGNEHTGQVRIAMHPILIDKYPVTQDIYKHVMDQNPSKFIGSRLPVESVSWFDAVTFCNRLSELVGLEAAYEILGKEAILHVKKSGYRLPYEAEWEYCCRGGSPEERYGSIDKIAWYNNGKVGLGTHEVGQMNANGFGLYDMLGNVWEWCNDWYQRRYPEGRQTDYIGAESGFERVLRGGSWSDLPNCIRASFRERKTPLSLESTNGLRIIRTI
jgi:formylglycine-generating enzyme required for sulfatase activity